jgi:nucleoside-diphosphate-sugar epimerase
VRILVTGAAGFIGSSLTERLIADGHTVVGLDAFVGFYGETVKRRNLATALASPAFEFAHVDLRTGDLDPLLDGVDVVVNEAAIAGLAPSWADLELYTTCNLIGLGRLLEASRRASVGRFLQISTSSVYGLNAVGDENRPLRPASPYGVTKLAAEHLVMSHVDAFGFPASILRYFSIYGPRQRPDMAYHKFIEAMLDGTPITIYGDGEQSRSNTFVTDCVEATVAAIDGAATGEVYNVGGGESITVNEAVSVIADALRVEPSLLRGPAVPGDQRHTRADTTKAERAFGYRPSIGPREGLRRQVQWHQALRGGADPR